MAEKYEGPNGQEGRDGPERQDKLSDGASAELKAILEAIIFASPEPLTRKGIDKLLASEPKEQVDAATRRRQYAVQGYPGAAVLQRGHPAREGLRRSARSELTRRAESAR